MWKSLTNGIVSAPKGTASFSSSPPAGSSSSTGFQSFQEFCSHWQGVGFLLSGLCTSGFAAGSYATGIVRSEIKTEVDVKMAAEIARNETFRMNVLRVHYDFEAKVNDFEAKVNSLFMDLQMLNAKAAKEDTRPNPYPALSTGEVFPYLSSVVNADGGGPMPSPPAVNSAEGGPTPYPPASSCSVVVATEVSK